MIIQTSAGQLFQVDESPNPDDINHCWVGIEVKRSKGHFVTKVGARKILVRKAACTLVVPNHA